MGFLFIDTTATTGGEAADVPVASPTPIDESTEVPVASPTPIDESTEPRTETAFDRRIRAEIEDARAGVLLCTGGPAAVIARWRPGDVRVRFSVRDADEPTNGCVQVAIGEVLVDPSQPDGTILHPLVP